MKKTILFLAVVLIAFGANAQEFPKNDNGDIEFSEVVEAKLTKEKLFANAKEWVATTFGDYKKVIQFEDNENCKLIIKGISNVDYATGVTVSGVTGMTKKEKLSYTITIECKDDKYRYKINDIVVNSTVIVLGTSVNEIPYTPDRHIELIMKNSNELENLKAIDSSKMKKKQLTEHSEKIESLEKSIQDEQNFYKAEYFTIESLISLIKKSMAVNDDF